MRVYTVDAEMFIGYLGAHLGEIVNIRPVHSVVMFS